MNVHKNARTTPRSRALLVHRVLREHWPVSAVAIAFGVSQRTVYKWLARYRAEGTAGLRDRSCAAHRRPHALATPWLELIKLMREGRLVAAEIAARLPLARSTVSAVLGRLGWGRLRYLEPTPPVQRYEWSRPGELVHVDTKKLGRIIRPSHRVTGNRRDTVDGAGWEYAHVAIDDCSRFAYVEILPDEKRYTATAPNHVAIARVVQCLTAQIRHWSSPDSSDTLLSPGIAARTAPDSAAQASNDAVLDCRTVRCNQRYRPSRRRG